MIGKKGIKGIALSAMTALGLDFNNLQNKNSSITGSHESDLEMRLQNVADRAKLKGSRKSTGKHHSLAMMRKEQKRKLRHQFRGEVNPITGLSSHYLKDGELVKRVA